MRKRHSAPERLQAWYADTTQPRWVRSRLSVVVANLKWYRWAVMTLNVLLFLQGPRWQAPAFFIQVGWQLVETWAADYQTRMYNDLLKLIAKRLQ
jgi:hypothetical protein